MYIKPLNDLSQVFVDPYITGGETHSAVDEIMVWNRALDINEINDLWDDGNGIDYNDMIPFTLNLSSDANGDVTVPGEGDFNYIANKVVTITATASTGYHFSIWSGDINSVNDINVASTTIIITADCNVKANFAINEYTLTYTAGTGGSITGDLSQGVSYGGNGTEVNAIPSEDYTFTIWTDGNTSSDRTDSNVTADVNVVALFAPPDANSLTISAGTGGTVTTPGIGTFWYSLGTDVNVAATSSTGYRFLNWTGDVNFLTSRYNSSAVVSVDANSTLTANFVRTGILSFWGKLKE
jgi:hypothetical protein